MKVNKNLQDAILNLNSLSIPRTEIVIGRIFSKPGQLYKDLFTEDEIKKFQNNLNINEQQLANIVNAFNFVLMHVVAERNLSQVEEVLGQNGMSQDHIEVFRQQWIQYGNEYSIRIREKPIAVQDVLHSFNWKISLQVDESRLPQKNVANFMNVDGKIEDANDLYSFDARNPATTFVFETKPSGETNKVDKFSIKFQKAQVQELFEQLESIQESLDKLI
ncbi:unnamed protein product [Paramecium pentaurelia]|uniref:COMM domain-containing protein n=1 Tax=Paramecium pentaurelia TaxID=43138 RepID=A0A8S1SBT3_9CILI|nr:unnamed protein product [Paramecium pentaurelia]